MRALALFPVLVAAQPQVIDVEINTFGRGITGKQYIFRDSQGFITDWEWFANIPPGDQPEKGAWTWRGITVEVRQIYETETEVDVEKMERELELPGERKARCIWCE